MAKNYSQKLGSKTNYIYPEATTDADAAAFLTLLEGGVDSHEVKGSGSTTTERTFPSELNRMVLTVGDTATKQFCGVYLKGVDPTKGDLKDMTATIVANFDKHYEVSGAPNYVKKRGDKL